MILRSLLFVPANSWRMIKRSVKEKTDAIILDLEDSVPIGEKETARWFIKDFLEDLRGKPVDQSIFVRVNSVGTGLLSDDLEFIVQRGLDGVVLPKTESSEDIKRTVRIIEDLEANRGIDKRIFLIPLIESARGIANLKEISASNGRVIAISFGAADFLRDLGKSYVELSDNQYELLYPRSIISITARANDQLAIDTPFLGLIIDKDGLKREAEAASKLGFKGKFAVHPSHIEIINKVFTPTEKEVEEAKGIIKAYEEAVSKGLGATTYAGRMIDEVHYKQAKKTLELINQIKKKEGKM